VSTVFESDRSEMVRTFSVMAFQLGFVDMDWICQVEDMMHWQAVSMIMKCRVVEKLWVSLIS
jgi:hypothetical protein